MLEYALIAGLLFGLYFSLIGLGLNLVFGVMRVVNLAHGDFLMLGGFAAYWLFTLRGVNPIFSMPIVFVAFALIGWPLYYLLVPRLQASKDPEMLSLILFFGLSQVIEACATIRLRHQRVLHSRRRAGQQTLAYLESDIPRLLDGQWHRQCCLHRAWSICICTERGSATSRAR